MSTLAEILEREDPAKTLEEHAAEIMKTRREAFEEKHRLQQELHRADGRDKRNEAIIAALRNDNFAAAEAFAEEFEKIGARLEGLADVTLDLVGGVVDEIALQEAEAEAKSTPNWRSQ